MKLGKLQMELLRRLDAGAPVWASCWGSRILASEPRALNASTLEELLSKGLIRPTAKDAGTTEYDITKLGRAALKGDARD